MFFAIYSISFWLLLILFVLLSSLVVLFDTQPVDNEPDGFEENLLEE